MARWYNLIDENLIYSLVNRIAFINYLASSKGKCSLGEDYYDLAERIIEINTEIRTIRNKYPDYKRRLDVDFLFLAADILNQKKQLVADEKKAYLNFLNDLNKLDVTLFRDLHDEIKVARQFRADLYSHIKEIAENTLDIVT
ncbi:MAG: hypothetical protein QXJ28_02085 [Candidatus Pacearchaeota archaeon]